MRSRRLLVLGMLALAAPCLAAYTPGQVPPAPTAANQHVVSVANSLYPGGFQWTPVSLPYSTNGSQVAIGGAIDTGSRLQITPLSSVSENGLSVVQGVGGASGNAIQVKNNIGGTTFSVSLGGTAAIVSAGIVNANSFGSAGGGGVNTVGESHFSAGPYTDPAPGTLAAFKLYGPCAVQSGSTSSSELYLRLTSGQSVPYVAGLTSAGASAWQIDQNANAQFAGTSTAVRTVAAPNTATLADSILLINGAYAETLPTTTNTAGRTYTIKNISGSAGASVTNTIDGTAGYSLAAGKYITVVWDGTTFRQIGGN